MIDAKRIEEMKRLSAEATSGPWKWGCETTYSSEELFSENGDNVLYGGCSQNSGYVVVSEEDASFIAESRQFVPDIIVAYDEHVLMVDAQSAVIKGLSEMVERRDDEIAKLRKALADVQSDCERAKKYYVEESDIDGILETVKDSLKRKERI